MTGGLRSTLIEAGLPDSVVAALPASSATEKVPASVSEVVPALPEPTLLVTGIEHTVLPDPLIEPIVPEATVQSVPEVALAVPQSSASLPVRVNESAVELVGELVTAARVRVGAVRSIVTVAATAAKAGPVLEAVSVAPLAAKVRMTVPAEQLVRATV